LAAAVLLAACGATATPDSSGSGASRTALVPLVSPMPTAEGNKTVTAAERTAWAQVRAKLPGAPVAAPVWIPGVLDRNHPTIVSVAEYPADPGYVISYKGEGRAIEFGMGDIGPPEGESGIGTRVRRAPAVLRFPASLFAEPTKAATRVVRWSEAGRSLWISSSTFTGGDLLHVAWELDLVGAPPAAHPYQRVRDGACASAIDPGATIDRLMSLIGSGDKDAVLDCFALDLIDVSPAFGNWSTLPKAIERAQQTVGEVGGRFQVNGIWTFASEPAGWTQGIRASQFFQVGPDGGRWRVFEVATAGYGSPP
jgi:hypothetical protein